MPKSLPSGEYPLAKPIHGPNKCWGFFFVNFKNQADRKKTEFDI